MSTRRRVLEADASAAGRARSLVHELGPQLQPGQLDDALLLVSELVTNAQRHGAAPIELRLELTDGRLRVEVQDAGDGFVALPPPPPEHEEGGRGLVILDHVAETWGVSRLSPAGKVVWFVVG